MTLTSIDDGSDAARQLSDPAAAANPKRATLRCGAELELLIARRDHAAALLPGRIVHVELEPLEPVDLTVTPDLVECSGGPLAIGGGPLAGVSPTFTAPGGGA